MLSQGLDDDRFDSASESKHAVRVRPALPEKYLEARDAFDCIVELSIQ
jgi:hypothetical protein